MWNRCVLFMSDTSVSEIVRRIIDAEPYLRECLAKGVINYSKLAKIIKPLVEHILNSKCSLNTLKMSLIRYAQKTQSKAGIEDKIRRSVMEILAKSSLEVKTGISVITLKINALPSVIKIVSELLGTTRFLTIMQGLTTVTMIVDDEHYSLIEKYVNKNDIVYSVRDQAAILIVSPMKIISTPGFIAYITSLLARSNINILQIESCHTDTVIIVSKNDMMKTLQLLAEAIELSKKYLAEMLANFKNNYLDIAFKG